MERQTSAREGETAALAVAQERLVMSPTKDGRVGNHGFPRGRG